MIIFNRRTFLSVPKLSVSPPSPASANRRQIAAKYGRLVIALSFPLLRPMIHSRGVLDDL